uniref:Uncharacterized protein n=1 Tax=Arundo donax TaxID=35708 RepID=A0A0A9G8Y2_ARUDO
MFGTFWGKKNIRPCPAPFHFLIFRPVILTLLTFSALKVTATRACNFTCMNLRIEKRVKERYSAFGTPE